VRDGIEFLQTFKRNCFLLLRFLTLYMYIRWGVRRMGKKVILLCYPLLGFEVFEWQSSEEWSLVQTPDQMMNVDCLLCWRNAGKREETRLNTRLQVSLLHSFEKLVERVSHIINCLTNLTAQDLVRDFNEIIWHIQKNHSSHESKNRNSFESL
jgi:hypothetical protein